MAHMQRQVPSAQRRALRFTVEEPTPGEDRVVTRGILHTERVSVAAALLYCVLVLLHVRRRR
jgi:hypothetical protein